MKEPNEQSSGMKLADTFVSLSGIANIAAYCVTPLIRSGMGKRSFFCAPLSFFLIAGYAEGHRSPAMQYYLMGWCGMVVLRFLTASRRVHSYYQGDPFWGKMRNYAGARVAEMLLLFFAAVLAATKSMALANFLLYGIVALIITWMIDEVREQAIIRNMDDAAHMADYMNNLRRNNGRR
jgi:hypothetical protein